METKEFKEQLEDLLYYRNERLAGGNIKNLSVAKLCYKEVMPKTKPVTQMTAEPVIMETKESDHAVCKPTAYQNYALTALQNMQKIPATQQDCVSECQNLTTTNPCLVNDAHPDDDMMQPSFCDGDFAAQLCRIEQMLREMYVTNQELFKSVIMYCQTYSGSGQ